MTASKLTISPSFTARGKHTSIVCTAEPITFDLDPQRLGAPVAAAIVEDIKKDLDALPGDRGKKTNKLHDGIDFRHVGNGVFEIIAPPGRLEHPNAMAWFRSEIAAMQKIGEKTGEAIEKSAAGMISKERMR